MALLPFQSANASQDLSGKSIYDTTPTQLREHPEYFIHDKILGVTIEDFGELLLHCEHTNPDRHLRPFLAVILSSWLTNQGYLHLGSTLFVVGSGYILYQEYKDFLSDLSRPNSFISRFIHPRFSIPENYINSSRLADMFVLFLGISCIYYGWHQ